MRYSEVIDNLNDSGADHWVIHERCQERLAAGESVVDMAIGQPDMDPPPALVDATIAALRDGRTGYALNAGESKLREVLAQRYTERIGRPIGAEQVMCFPGTQTALYAVMRALAGPGNEVLVGDPMYATYNQVVTACGAQVVSVPLDSERGFRIDPADLAARVTPATSAILLNTPHNPTGAVLTREDLLGIAEVANTYDLAIVADEVYEEMVFDGVDFCSPLSLAEIADRVVVVSSISKSHAAPGFRSGWCIGPAEFCRRLEPLLEAMIFGNQPFIADGTAEVVQHRSPLARIMAQRFASRARHLASEVHAGSGLRVSTPDAGMFVLVDVSASGMNGFEYATDLLDKAGVGVMPGASFGDSLENWIRIALTPSQENFDVGCERIVKHAASVAPPSRQ